MGNGGIPVILPPMVKALKSARNRRPPGWALVPKIDAHSVSMDADRTTRSICFNWTLQLYHSPTRSMATNLVILLLSSPSHDKDARASRQRTSFADRLPLPQQGLRTRQTECRDSWRSEER